MRIVFLFLFLLILPFVSSACVQNWQCSNWSACVSNLQIRACGDLNSCHNETNRPPEERFCGTVCTTNWNCTSWNPINCPENQTQARTCTDINNCNNVSGKPEEIQICEFKIDYSWVFYFIVALTVILILGAIWIMVNRFRGR